MIDLEQLPENAIAIIGMSCRFPKADNPQTFWQNLKDGLDMITDFDDEHLRSVGVDENTINDPKYIKSGAFIENVDMFDANFFDFSPREAEVTGPQQRFLLECCYEALQDAGYSSDKYKGAIGLFSGNGQGGYLQQNIMSNPDLFKNMGRKTLQFGNELTFSSTQVSYKLNLTGPSVSLATACSTSLVAVHMACKSLLTYESDIALAGAAHVAVDHDKGYYSPEGGIHSKDGRCRAFDADGSGVVSGNGAGVVVLKRLEEAIEDGDHIDAIILSSAINNDGKTKVGYTAPSIKGQSLVIAEAQQLATLKAEDISYIEAHGTATPMGDPVEITALTKAFEVSSDKKQFCAIGSLKSNLGHMSTAAGIGSLIKTIMSLKNKQIPATLHVNEPNPTLNLPNTPFYLNTELNEWKAPSAGRIAGISGFGMGGTNAHIIVKEWIEERVEQADEQTYQTLTISAKTPTALEKSVVRLKQYLANNVCNLSDLAFTLNIGRDDFAYRTAIVCKTREEALEALENHSVNAQAASDNADKRVVFMFAGQGAQHVQMAKELYENSDIFRHHFDACINVLCPLGIDLEALLYGDDEEKNTRLLQESRFTQVSLFVIEYALAKLWMAWGVKPSAMIGHSVGEYVAACLAGVFKLEDALELVVERGRLMQLMPKGRMVSVPMSEQQVSSFIGDKVSIAAINGPELTVVSGADEAIEAFLARLPQSIEYKDVNLNHAFHSYQMHCAAVPFKALLQKLRLDAPQLPFVSNVSGKWITDQQATDPNYWVEHMVGCVKFWPGIEMLMQSDSQIFLDVGPNRVMTSLVSQPQAQERNVNQSVVVPSLPHVKEGIGSHRFWMTGLSKLWCLGVTIDWAQYYEDKTNRRLRLPTYPFERQRYWVEPNKSLNSCTALGEQSYQDRSIEQCLYQPLWKQVKLLTSSLQFDSYSLTQRTWLVFDCLPVMSAALKKVLVSKGQAVIEVNSGAGFRKLAPRCYELDIENRNDYDCLIESLRKDGIEIDNVIHGGALDTQPLALPIEDIVQFSNRSYFSLLYLQQALAKGAEFKDIQLVSLGNGLCDLKGQGDINPFTAPLSVLTRVIGQEFEWVKSCYVDVQWSEKFNQQFMSEGLIAESVDRVAAQIYAEFKEKLPLPLVALIGCNRFVEHYSEFNIAGQTLEAPVVKENGVYLISGGLTGIGLEIASYLTENYQAKVVILSRRDPSLLLEDTSSSFGQRIAQMQSWGGHVMLLQSDVCNLDQLFKVREHVTQQWGDINGIVHSAGIAGGGFMELKTKADVEQVFAAKVQGSLNLIEVFKHQPLDFMLMCSSQNALKGGIARSDYGAANAFMDGLAAKYSHSKNLPIISVNWCAWRETGMAFENHQQKSAGEAKKHGISNVEGTGLFDLIIKSGLRRVITSKKPFELVMQEQDAGIKFEDVVKASSKTLQQRPSWLSTKYQVPRDEMEAEIAEIWHDLIGVSPIGVHDQFFELGGNSLLMVQLVMLISKQLSVKLSMQEFLEAPTIALLAEYILTRSVNEDELDNLERLLAEFE